MSMECEFVPLRDDEIIRSSDYFSFNDIPASKIKVYMYFASAINNTVKHACETYTGGLLSIGKGYPIFFRPMYKKKEYIHGM